MSFFQFRTASGAPFCVSIAFVYEPSMSAGISHVWKSLCFVEESTQAGQQHESRRKMLSKTTGVPSTGMVILEEKLGFSREDAVFANEDDNPGPLARPSSTAALLTGVCETSCQRRWLGVYSNRDHRLRAEFCGKQGRDGLQPARGVRTKALREAIMMREDCLSEQAQRNRPQRVTSVELYTWCYLGL